MRGASQKNSFDLSELNAIHDRDYAFALDMFTCMMLEAYKDSRPMQLLIIADDLTGALDSAATLAMVGLRCVVARRPVDLPDAAQADTDVVAVSTASREGTADAACAAVENVFGHLPVSPEIIFKKIDSRLKGHIGTELSVVGAWTGIGRALVAPAIPSQGRTVENGCLIGRGVNVPIDIAACAGGSGLVIDVPGAQTDADLDRAVANALAGPPVLLVGAAGLAGSLGRYLRPDGHATPPKRLSAPLLLAIGSCDPITLAQVDALRGLGLLELAAYDGCLAEIPAPEAAVILVRLLGDDNTFDPKRAGASFARSIATLLDTTMARSVLACGGETANAILDELGVGVLRVSGELLSGVPVSTMVVKGRTIRLVTKSGGFGERDALLAVVKATTGAREDDHP
jgi:D-threonate/D-erythronate kinase